MTRMRPFLRQFTRWRCGVLVLVALWSCTPEAPVETLRVLAWPGYADPDLVETFERRYNVDVDVTFVETDDEMWALVSEHQGAGFDVFAVNTAELKRYIDSGLSVALNTANIPNIQHQLPRFNNIAGIPGIVRDYQVYAIPYTYSAMGLIFDKHKVTPAPVSMDAMWDPRYQGRVLAYDGSNHNFSITALLLGVENPFHLDEQQFQAATRKLVALRRNVLTFYRSPEEVVELFRDNDVALVFGNYGEQQVKMLREAGFDVGMMMPAEGALSWLDCWAVTRGARNRGLAENWINYTLEKNVSLALSDRQGLANTIAISPPLVEGANDKIIWLEPVEDFSRRMQLWESIRSGDRIE